MRLPQRGMIGIFNRSYYEEVLSVRVHPEYLAGEGFDPGQAGKAFWKERYRSINNLERHLHANKRVLSKSFSIFPMRSRGSAFWRAWILPTRIGSFQKEISMSANTGTVIRRLLKR